MNHIHQLQHETRQKGKIIKKYEELVHELSMYLLSDKFAKENYVNVNDVLSRMENKEQEVAELEDQL